MIVEMDNTPNMEGCVTHGPWGSKQGNIWVYKPQGFYKKMKIIVGHGDVVQSLSFKTKGGNGEAQTSTFGCTAASKTDTICIDFPNEYLMSINGTYEYDFESYYVVRSLCFRTNLNFYGPYGTPLPNKIEFSHGVTDQVIVGFHGRARKYITAIGVYTMPKSLALAPSHMPELSSSMSRNTSMSRIAMPKEAGPWGASAGKPWDDGFFSSIIQARVHLGKLNVIYALQFEYLKSDGNYVFSQLHGGTDGSNIELVDLDGKDEYLTGISGFYGPIEGYNGLEAIVSITFYTNVKTYGPYGEETGAGYVYFSSTPSPGKIAGFHGRGSKFLTSIGVHMEYY